MSNKEIYSKEQWDWIAERYIEGYHLKELAKFLGIHHNTLLNHFLKMNVSRIPKRFPLSERKSEFMSLCKEYKDENK